MPPKAAPAPPAPPAPTYVVHGCATETRQFNNLNNADKLAYRTFADAWVARKPWYLTAQGRSKRTLIMRSWKAHKKALDEIEAQKQREQQELDRQRAIESDDSDSGMESGPWPPRDSDDEQTDDEDALADPDADTMAPDQDETEVAAFLIGCPDIPAPTPPRTVSRWVHDATLSNNPHVSAKDGYEKNWTAVFAGLDAGNQVVNVMTNPLILHVEMLICII